MNNLRSEFEELPDIKKILDEKTHSFKDGYYRFKGNTNDIKLVYVLGYVNGSWVMFQELNK